MNAPSPLESARQAMFLLSAITEAQAAHNQGGGDAAVFTPLLRALCALSESARAAVRSGDTVLAQVEGATSWPPGGPQEECHLPLRGGPGLGGEPLGVVTLSGRRPGHRSPPAALEPLLVCATTLLAARHAERRAQALSADAALLTFYEEALSQGRAVLWEWDVLRGRVRSSPSIGPLYGYGPEWQDIPQERLADLIHSEDLPAMARRQRALREGQGVRDGATLRVRDAHGGTRWVASEGIAYRDAEGRLQRVIGLAIDVTESKRLKDEIVFRSSLLNRVRCVILVVGVDGKLIYMNRYAEERYGWTAEELLGGPPSILIPPEMAEQSLLSGRIMRSCGHWEGEFIALHRDGTRFPLQCSTSELHDSVGALVGYVLVATDISQQKRIQAQLETALAERELLLREVHHRVKNNLQIISSLLNLQLRRSKSAMLQEFLRDSQIRIRSMSLVHESLLRSEDLADIDVAQYVRALVSGIVQSYSQRDKRIQVHCDVERLPLGLDGAIRVGLIVNELVLNALKHAFPRRRSGEVWIRLGRRDGEAALAVVDSGVGLPVAVDLEKGRTIGLHLVSSLVGQLKGRLAVSRDSPTTFEVRFPCEEGVTHGA